MEAIENWSWVRGQIEAVKEAPIADHLAVTIVIDAVEPVENYPNLLHKERGDRLTVYVRRSAMAEEGGEAGAVFSARVRRASLDRVYADPDRVKVEPSAGER